MKVKYQLSVRSGTGTMYRNLTLCNELMIDDDEKQKVGVGVALKIKCAEIE